MVLINDASALDELGTIAVTYDIDAINAAMRLGDRIVPSVGTICRIDVGGGESYKVLGHVSRRKETVILKVRRVSPDNKGRWVFAEREIAFYHLWRMTRVIELPEDSLPFPEWERL